MSIKTQLRLINRLDQNVSELQKKYAQHPAASLELRKLKNSIEELEKYLDHVNQNQANYNKQQINNYVEAINLHLDILKVELEKNDYKKLYNGVKVVRTILRFHPTRYSFFTFILAWIYEMLYFI